MKFVEVAKTLIGLGVAAGAAIVIWPEQVDRFLPGAGERGLEWRAQLPNSITAHLPAAKSNTAAKTADARPSEGGRPAEGGRPGAGGPAGRPPVPVNTEMATRGPIPFRIDAVGTVQPIATIALKTRIDAQVEKIFVADGSSVKAGDMLVKLDSRQIEAQIKQTEATIAKDVAAVEQSTRDVARLEDLLSKGSGTQLNLDTARTQLSSGRAQLAADQAVLENQRVQLSWYTLSAPINGRLGTFSSKAGNIIRSGDNTSTGTLATIVQTAPIYVSFAVPQAVLADLRAAITAGTAEAVATPQGSTKSSRGKVAFIDNTVDQATGSVTIRAVFENSDDFLWAGQLCNVRVTVRIDQDIVSIPRTATQAGQIGNYVYVIDNGVARVRNVKVQRFQDGRDIISEGLKGDETLVTDGALQLIDGGRVNIKKAETEKGAI